MSNTREVDKLDAIWRITAILQKSTDLQEALMSALSFAVKEMQAEAGTLWLQNKNDRRLYPVFSIGGEASAIRGMSLAMGEGIAGYVAQSCEETVIPDCTKDERFAPQFDKKTGFITKNMVCVPLLNKQESIGSIQVMNIHEDSLFAEDVALLKTIASVAAIAIADMAFQFDYADSKKVLFEVRNLGKSYTIGDEPVQILNDISFDIFDNELLVILGASGCGKTTLLNVLGCMDKADQGEIWFEGTDLTKLSEKQVTLFRRDTIGFVFQFYNLMPNLTAKENVDYVVGLHKTDMTSETALELVELSDRRDSFPSQLSGGQQQRVSIARAVVKKPRIIFADEPTGALDFQTGRTVLMALEKIVRSNNGTVVIVTHNIEIAKMADRVIHISRGRIADVNINSNVIPACELNW